MTINTAGQITTLRTRYKLTQRALADLLGTTETTVSRLERGATPLDTRWVSHLDLLAQHLRSSPAGWSHA